MRDVYRLILPIASAAIIGCGSSEGPAPDATVDAGYNFPDVHLVDVAPRQFGSLVEVAPSDFEKEVLKEPHPVVVKFGASWCGPCQYIKPFFEKLAADNPYVKCVNFELTQPGASAIAAQYQNQYIPDFHFFYGGTDYSLVDSEKYRVQGAYDEKLQPTLDQFLKDIVAPK